MMAVMTMVMASSIGQTSRIQHAAVLMRYALSASRKANSSIRVISFFGGSKHHTPFPKALALYFGTG